MTEKKVSIRYARALLNTSSDAGNVDTVYEDLININKIFETSREIRNLTSSPIFPVWKKKKIYEEIFKEIKISELTMKFLILLLDKGRGTLIPHIIQQYINLYNSINKIVPVVFSTARELNHELKLRLINKIKEYTQMNVLPSFRVVPELRGGIQISINDWVYDATIKNQLEILYKSLIENK